MLKKKKTDVIDLVDKNYRFRQKIKLIIKRLVLFFIISVLISSAFLFLLFIDPPKTYVDKIKSAELVNWSIYNEDENPLINYIRVENKTDEIIHVDIKINSHENRQHTYLLNGRKVNITVYDNQYIDEFSVSLVVFNAHGSYQKDKKICEYNEEYIIKCREY
ncbi:MAG: hypothetical protein NZM04_00735 [Methylacidiphilales bacterium]|nr:hypothetical protein [Candidatus Methylacidiphilales bacterium]